MDSTYFGKNSLVQISAGAVGLSLLPETVWVLATVSSWESCHL